MSSPPQPPINNNHTNNHRPTSRTAMASAAAALATAASAPTASGGGSNPGTGIMPGGGGGGGVGRREGRQQQQQQQQQQQHRRSRMVPTSQTSYPLPAYLKFVPGGVEYPPASRGKAGSSSSSSSSNAGFFSGRAATAAAAAAAAATTEEGVIHLSRYIISDASSSSSPTAAAAAASATSPMSTGSNNSRMFPYSSRGGGGGGAAAAGGGGGGGASSSPASPSSSARPGPEVVIRKALSADALLRKYALFYHSRAVEDGRQDATTLPGAGGGGGGGGGGIPFVPPPGHRLPSLAVLAESAFVNPLTGVPASSAVGWAERMILEYADGRYERIHPNDPAFLHKTDEYGRPLPAPTALDGKAANLVGRATVAAWAADAAALGRTPPQIPPHAPNIFDARPDDAHALPPPSLVSFLNSLHVLQRGENPTVACGAVMGAMGGVGGGGGGGGVGCASPGYSGGPCGYIFRRGDIAWNCRTCQADSTCVLCDSCFHNSDHEGHEVFFHRTSPGGCCDCGDREAWKGAWCCSKYRAADAEEDDDDEEDEEGGGVGAGGGGGDGADGEGMNGTEGDDFEAVRAAKRGRSEHERSVDGLPTKSPTATEETKRLPPRLAAAMGVVIGSVVRSVVKAAEASAIGADVSQWRLKWADDISRIWNGVPTDEDYYRRFPSVSSAAAKAAAAAGGGFDESTSSPWTVPEHVLDSSSEQNPIDFPRGYLLYLRLHNDDVHTFDEVIVALHSEASRISVPVGGIGSRGVVGGAGSAHSPPPPSDHSGAGAGGGQGLGSDNHEDSSMQQQRSLRNRPPPQGDVEPLRRQRLRGDNPPNAIEPSTDADAAAAAASRGGRASHYHHHHHHHQQQQQQQQQHHQQQHHQQQQPPSFQPPAPSYRREIEPSGRLISRPDHAQELTKRVDSDGQVLVREFRTMDGAGMGFSRLRKGAGLQCSVVGTAAAEAEERAKALLEWLSTLSSAHPAVAAMIVQALADTTDGEDVLCGGRRKKGAGGGGRGADNGQPEGVSRGVAVWGSARMMPCWSGTHEDWWNDDDNHHHHGVPAWKKRMEAFPPHLESSYLTREEGRELFRRGIMVDDESLAEKFVFLTGADPSFYSHIPYSLPDSRLLKSPHALWGMLPSSHIATSKPGGSRDFAHPLLIRAARFQFEDSAYQDDLMEATGKICEDVHLRENVYVLDTDLRKHQEADKLTSTLYPHRLSGLNLISGVGHVDKVGSTGSRYGDPSMGVIPKEIATRITSCTSFVAPASSILLLLLLDPYPPKNLRASLHRLFLSLLTDSRFKSRFAAALGAVVYRPTSTLFCAGIGTEADTLLGFTVQLFTTGSLVRALGNLDATKALLSRDDKVDETERHCVSAIPIAHSVARSIHTNILGATKEVSMVVKNVLFGNEDGNIVTDDDDLLDLLNFGPSGAGAGAVAAAAADMARSTSNRTNSSIPSLVYQFGSEHPLNTRLPAAPDDKFLDSRCMKHKRLPQLLRDLEYIFETPGTAVKLLRSSRPLNISIALSGVDNVVVDSAITPASSFSSPISPPNSLSTYNIPSPLDFPVVWARLLRLSQGIDLQKRRISGGHVEYEDPRWLEAFGLSLNLSGTGDVLSESPFSSMPQDSGSAVDKLNNREAMGNLFAAFFREIKMWLYREGLLEAGLLRPSPVMNLPGELEALQRSTLHVSSAQLCDAAINDIVTATGVSVAQSCDVACEIGVKNLPETKLALIEAAILHERIQLRNCVANYKKDRGDDDAFAVDSELACSPQNTCHGVVMGDLLKVPHSPLAGDCFSFHLPLHRALARSIRCFFSTVVSTEERLENPNSWWRLPVLDDDDNFLSSDQDTLSALVRPVLKSSNFRVVWSNGPECTTPEAQLRRSRSRAASAFLASAKVVHSLCDHPLRCIAASQQIDHHMWAKNGGPTAGMSMNYASAPLCRSLRDLDLTLVQLSASGLKVGLGARRVFSLLTNRFSMDGYLCDPDRRAPRNSYGRAGWVKPPRMQAREHPELLAESFFTTLCVIVSDLPQPPPSSLSDDSGLRQTLRRELLHALAVEARSHSEAMFAASAAVSRRDESDGGPVGASGASSFRSIFTEILNSVGQQRSQGSRASSGPPMFDLRPNCSNEYDPSFYHLRRTDHQHAMDNIARLRKQKLNAVSKKASSVMVLPLVTEPPTVHPRFSPARLLLHLPSMYAAIRRSLMFVLFDGSWLPPSEPEPELAESDTNIGSEMKTIPSDAETLASTVTASNNTFAGRATANSRQRRRVKIVDQISDNPNSGVPIFSPDIVASSSKSFLEVLQILTLQAHTLEECSNLHRTLSFLDLESRNLSASISINSYLDQLVHVPNSLVNVWALLPAPAGPLPSKGSGDHRGSVLGLLIALYEHRGDHGNGEKGGKATGNEDHGGARDLSADGLKWLLRFVNALVDGAGTVLEARICATNGVPCHLKDVPTARSRGVRVEVCDKIRGMLANIPDLWPGEKDVVPGGDPVEDKAKLARKAAQARAIAKMKKHQASFAASISSQFGDYPEKKLNDDGEANLCIICKCDDADGNHGSMGYLGHVQRSRVMQLNSKCQIASNGGDLNKLYRVVGDKGCQLRSTKSMDSSPIAFLQRGSIVEILETKISQQLGLLSRRVLVRHVTPEKTSASDQPVQGWASVQSWQGYVILSPISNLCYANTRWGPTRPIIRQCGHAAHFRCVEAHCLSLHQRAAGDQPYDGRFAANIEDGEFLCPLCKQLSNILIPADGNSEVDDSPLSKESVVASGSSSLNEEKEAVEMMKTDAVSLFPFETSLLRNVLVRKCYFNFIEKPDPKNERDKSIRQFGSNLSQAMQLSIVGSARRKEQESWHPSLRRWDFEDDEAPDPEGKEASSMSGPRIGSVLRLMRQQLISWAAVGHSAAAAEAAGRGVRQTVFGEVTYSVVDPWGDYGTSNRDAHPMLLELRRSLTATASLTDVVTYEIGNQLGGDEMKTKGEGVAVIGNLICDILEGRKRLLNSLNGKVEKQWMLVTALIASMMCHVSKDDAVEARVEARNVAAAMWATKSLGTSNADTVAMEVEALSEVELDRTGNILNRGVDASNMEDLLVEVANATSNRNRTGARFRPIVPPKPLSVHRVEETCDAELEPEWGTMNPFNVESHPDKVEAPFRPAVASAFLYVPLLAWDMNILAGAVFSNLLSNTNSALSVSYNEIIQSSHILMIGRLVQVLATPNGFSTSPNNQDSFDEFDDEQLWDVSKINRESSSLKDLLSLCRQNTSGPSVKINDADLLRNVGNAILPFGRSLVLLLRASFCVIRQRQRRKTTGAQATKTNTDQRFANTLEGRDVMTSEDGFQVLELLGGPLPSELMKVTSESNTWLSLIKRWLSALLGFEAYHGSRGDGLVYKSDAWVRSIRRNKEINADKSIKDARGKNHSSSLNEMPESRINSSTLQNLHVETSAAAVEVAHVAPPATNAGNAPGGASDDLGDYSDDFGEEEYDEDIESNASEDIDIMDVVDNFNEDTDEELEHADMDVDLGEAGIDFGATRGELGFMAAHDLDLDIEDDASDVDANHSDHGDSKFLGPDDHIFAYVSRSAIIPYQPSILGLNGVGPGPRDSSYVHTVVNDVMTDFSHLGIIHKPGSPIECLIKLPRSFVELYGIVNRVKGRDGRGGDDADDDGGFETAICLLTGAIMRSGTIRRVKTNRPPGTCTLHAKRVGSGIGIFFLVQKCTVLLMHNNKSAYSPSLYVDEHGEEDPGLKRGRPLFFSETRYHVLENLWRSHGIPREVSQIRSTSDRVIRDNWY